MRKFLLVPFLFCTLLLWGQDDWYMGKPISDFAFVGLDTVAETELRPLVDSYKGTAFSLEVFWEIQDKLYALDYFQTIEASAKPADDTRSAVVVEFTVKEKPTIAEVTLEGNRRLRRNEILERVLLKAGDMAKARDGFTVAAASEYLPEPLRRDAQAQLALVERKLQAAPAPTSAKVAICVLMSVRTYARVMESRARHAGWSMATCGRS